METVRKTGKRNKKANITNKNRKYIIFPFLERGFDIFKTKQQADTAFQSEFDEAFMASVPAMKDIAQLGLDVHASNLKTIAEDKLFF